MMWTYVTYDELYHHGIKGQKWGQRRFQYEDGSLTEEGRKRYELKVYTRPVPDIGGGGGGAPLEDEAEEESIDPRFEQMMSNLQTGPIELQRGTMPVSKVRRLRNNGSATQTVAKYSSVKVSDLVKRK